MVKNTKGGSSHKKMARKNEDVNKTIKVNLDINFKKDNMLVFIEKNLGNCFSGKLLHFIGANDFGEDLKIMHQRGKKGKSNFDHSQSKIALVSIITGLTLSTKCVGIVEEFLEIDHINAYLSNNLISQEVYDKLNMIFSTSSKNNNNQEEDLGFEFDRNNENVDEVDNKKVKFKEPIEEEKTTKVKESTENTDSSEEDATEDQDTPENRWSKGNKEGKGGKGGKGVKGGKDDKRTISTKDIFSRINSNADEDSGWSFWGDEQSKEEKSKEEQLKNLKIEEI
jgi:hypothetical protein